MFLGSDLQNSCASIAQTIAQFRHCFFPCACAELSLSHGTQERATIAYFHGLLYNRRAILQQSLAQGDAACSCAHLTRTQY